MDYGYRTESSPFLIETNATNGFSKNEEILVVKVLLSGGVLNKTFPLS